MADKDKTVHVMRTYDWAHTGKRIWIAFDETNLMKGTPGMSKATLLTMWSQNHGKFNSVIRYEGVAQVSEAVATVSSVRRTEDGTR